MFLGAKLGSGKQWFPWIHIEDIWKITERAIENESMKGPYNCVAPQAVTNSVFTKIMSDAVGRPVILPFVPGIALRLILGEFGSVILKGQRAIPEKLQKEGYTFAFPDLESGLKDLM
jgi:uncharacterized protein (TIGR01777 family)